MADLAAAKRDLAEAELEMCATPLERVHVLEKMVATATLLEAQAERLAAQGAASEEAWLKTRAAVLQLRIRLQEARSKAVGELGGCDENPPLLKHPR